MAQTEEMLRLIKDGKPVGLERRRVIKGNIVIIEHCNLDCSICNEVAPYMVDDHQDWIKHDSFELGIKVKDDTCVECQADPTQCHEHKAEWWFEGDKVEHKYQPKINGVLKYDGFVWAVTNEIKGLISYIFNEIDISRFERIGNIHEDK